MPRLMLELVAQLGFSALLGQSFYDVVRFSFGDSKLFQTLPRLFCTIIVVRSRNMHLFDLIPQLKDAVFPAHCAKSYVEGAPTG
ncbi:MAG: hypothetical protein B9J98_00715 [Candidatus Terraquivivens tikiterensis]|uniref:Uncharacterized protein n=1 Tax=Candidatus Terraquivivens tikiterensis TaxID=1980982 RepID=A0A2R7YAF5_9ARCH|nr:MAG: hypothetical protein B9J98_00715 [Candidatus Terraquivivens tikiterensis]